MKALHVLGHDWQSRTSAGTFILFVLMVVCVIGIRVI